MSRHALTISELANARPLVSTWTAVFGSSSRQFFRTRVNSGQSESGSPPVNVSVGVLLSIRGRLSRISSNIQRSSTASSLSGISGWTLSLNPLARGGRRIWRGEKWKYGFGGAVAGLGLLISGSRRRPRRSQLRGQLRHDPIAAAGWGVLRRPLSPAFRAGLYPLIPWRVGAEESGAAKNGSMASA